jgi:hypothetical protein
MSNVRHSSESAEHFTPAFLVDRVRAALGGIDLDPASCEEANRQINATHYYTEADNGLMHPWNGRVFLNPPGGRIKINGSLVPSQKHWWFKLAREFVNGSVTAAAFVCFSIELLQNTQVKTPLGLPIPLDFPICFPSRRVAYVKPGGEVGAQPPHASAIVFLGGDVDRFAALMAPIGRVIVPREVWKPKRLHILAGLEEKSASTA